MEHRPRIRKRDENLLFLKTLLKNPRALGAIAPSSAALATFICRHVKYCPDSYVVEIGAGTGRFTNALLKSGISPEKLYVIELDKAMATFLKKSLPHVNIIEGSAADLSILLPLHIVGKVATIVSGIPMVSLAKELQHAIAFSCFQVLREDGQLLQFTYGPLSPLPAQKLHLKAKRLGHVFFNIPPATVWQYQQFTGVRTTFNFNNPFFKISKHWRHLRRRYNRRISR